MKNPCQRCGACCAFYKVPIPAAEADDRPGGFVPAALTVAASGGKRVMKGTQGFLKKRCAALIGTIGVDVACRVYDHRPSACRNFLATWEFKCGGNPLCDRARAVYGMYPFESY